MAYSAQICNGSIENLSLTNKFVHHLFVGSIGDLLSNVEYKNCLVNTACHILILEFWWIFHSSNSHIKKGGMNISTSTAREVIEFPEPRGRIVHTRHLSCVLSSFHKRNTQFCMLCSINILDTTVQRQMKRNDFPEISAREQSADNR